MYKSSRKESLPNDIEKYIKALRYLVLALQKRLIKFYKKQPCNEQKFYQVLYKIQRNMIKVELEQPIQYKLADKITPILTLISQPTQNRRVSALSKGNFSSWDKNSKMSFDFSMDQDRSVNQRESRIQSISKHNFPKKGYYSLQTMKSGQVINQDEREYFQEKTPKIVRKYSNNEFKVLKYKLQSPKLGEFIQKIKNQTKAVIKQHRERQKVQPYLGQRRKKVKKSAKTIQFRQ